MIDALFDAFWKIVLCKQEIDLLGGELGPAFVISVSDYKIDI